MVAVSLTHESIPWASKIIKSSLSTDLQSVLRCNKLVLAGGACRAIFAKEPISDFDIYGTQANLLKAQEYLDNPNNGFAKLQSTKNAETYKDKGNIVQLVKLYDVSNTAVASQVVQEVLARFDFTCCQGAYSFLEDAFYYSNRFFTSLASKRLEINSELAKPIASYFRLYKFIKRGYTIDPKQMWILMLKMMQQLEKVNKIEDLMEAMGAKDIDPDYKTLWDSAFGGAAIKDNIPLALTLLQSADFLEEMVLSY